MKTVNISLLFASLVTAHSAVWKVTFDGTTYPARDVRLDNLLGAKRIEWSFKDVNNFPWMAVTDVLDPGIACGIDAKAPELKAVARAGANVTVQWSGIIKMHQGPVMSYLGAWPSPDMKATDIKFFKISEAGFDKKRHMWANEDLINRNTADTFQIPSDIKPGLYVLRTELLALHGNRVSSEPTLYSGPQFYTHCFNVEILGNGNAAPEGVKFPGGYKRDDPGVKFNLYKSEAEWDNYIIPGPPVYQGKHEAPTGQPPVVSPKDTGAFPPEFEAKYVAYKKKIDEYATKSHTFYNGGSPGAKGKANENFLQFTATHNAENQVLQKELVELKAEAVKLGIANP